MKYFRTMLLIGVVVLLAVAGGSAVAGDTPDPGTLAGVDATVAPAISYQGRLIDPATRDPLTGAFDFQFSFWDDPVAGNQVGAVATRTDQTVSDGYYRTTIEIDPELVDGTAMWMEILVRERGTTAWDTMSPRVEVLPVMYAMTVRPGARIAGAVAGPDAIVNATNTATGSGLRGESLALGGYGVVGYNGSGEPSSWGAGVKGSSMASGYGVVGTTEDGHGTAVAGYTQDGYGVRGTDTGSDQGRGYGGYFTSSSGVGAFGWSWATSSFANRYAPGLFGLSTNGTGVYGRSDSGSGLAAGVMGWGRTGPGGRFLSYNGNIVEGWKDVSGSGSILSLLFKVSDAGNVYADGAYLSPAADLAELLPAQAGLEPGDVLVVGLDGQLARSSEAYQPTIVGVYSTKPAFLGGTAEDAGGKEVQVMQGGEDVASDKQADALALTAGGKAPLAIAGVVPVKASAENGPITPGALLVASDTPGHCMLAGDATQIGTVLGKALEGLDSGTGVIQMLVMLQ